MENKIIKMMLLFGGVSSEHEVSRVSAASVLEHINMDKYEIIKVGITWPFYPPLGNQRKMSERAGSGMSGGGGGGGGLGGGLGGMMGGMRGGRN